MTVFSVPYHSTNVATPSASVESSDVWSKMYLPPLRRACAILWSLSPACADRSANLACAAALRDFTAPHVGSGSFAPERYATRHGGTSASRPNGQVGRHLAKSAWCQKRSHAAQRTAALFDHTSSARASSVAGTSRPSAERAKVLSTHQLGLATA
jgi:hypothetical protein